MNAHRRNIQAAILVTAGFLLAPGNSYAGGFAGGIFRTASCDMIWYMQGSLGALLMATAVLFGVAAAAVGNSKAITSAIFAGIGAYAMYDVVIMQFGDIGCSTSGQGRAGRSAEVQVVPASEEESRQANPFSVKEPLVERAFPSESAPQRNAAAAEDADDDTASQNAWRALSAE